MSSAEGFRNERWRRCGWRAPQGSGEGPIRAKQGEKMERLRRWGTGAEGKGNLARDVHGTLIMQHFAAAFRQCELYLETEGSLLLSRGPARCCRVPRNQCSMPRRPADVLHHGTNTQSTERVTRTDWINTGLCSFLVLLMPFDRHMCNILYSPSKCMNEKNWRKEFFF